MTLPDDWTDDMNFPIGSGKNCDDLASWFVSSLKVGADYELLFADLIREFSLTDENAELAFDRAQGGIVRAVTGNLANKPDSERDPLAFRTFELVWQTFPRKFKYFGPRVPSGLWVEWYESR